MDGFLLSSSVLGFTTNDYGVIFEFKGDTDPKKKYLQLGTFEDLTDYFGASNQQAMLNFHFDKMDDFKNQLIESNVKIVDEIESYSYDKFLHIEDHEGKKLNFGKLMVRSLRILNILK